MENNVATTDLSDRPRGGPSSLCGFLLIALLGSLLDAPRLTLLVYLFIAAALYLPRAQAPAVAH